jgi:hypothetical protein
VTGELLEEIRLDVDDITLGDRASDRGEEGYRYLRALSVTYVAAVVDDNVTSLSNAFAVDQVDRQIRVAVALMSSDRIFVWDERSATDRRPAQTTGGKRGLKKIL